MVIDLICEVLHITHDPPDFFCQTRYERMIRLEAIQVGKIFSIVTRHILKILRDIRTGRHHNISLIIWLYFCSHI